MSFFFFLFLLFVDVVFGGVLPNTNGVTCKDNNGKPVDWFVFYKLPRQYNNPISEHAANGTAFMYLDSNNKQWKLMDMGMEDENHAIYYTLEQYYTMDASNTFSIMYNDEYPDSTIWSDDSGHCKGVSVFDSSNGGFWLLHSIPKFPSNHSYAYPPNAHTYGQSGICISFDTNTLSDVSHQIYYIQPFTYQINVPSSFVLKYPYLGKLKQGLYQQTEPYTSQKILRSRNGAPFFHFAKTALFGKDLYYDLLAPTLRTSLKVQTWQHGAGNLFSWCNQQDINEVFNAKSIRLPFGVNFTNYYDHSKYAISFDERAPNRVLAQPGPTPFVCIADINRQEHQTHRAGGAFCLADPGLHDAYKNVIDQIYPCNGTHVGTV